MTAYLNTQTEREAAIEFLKMRLAQGNTLGQRILEVLDLQSGRISALIPRALSSSELTEFEFGHQLVDALNDANSKGIVPVENAIADLATLINGSLERMHGFCFLENSIARAGDKWLQTAKSDIVTCGGEVYHVLSPKNYSESIVRQAILDARQIPNFLGAIGVLPLADVSSILTNKRVTRELFQSFVPSVHWVFAGAYDGEGYLVWSKKRS